MNALLRPLSLAAVAAALARRRPRPPPTPHAPLPAPDAEKQKVIDRILAIFHPENGVAAGRAAPGLDAMQQSDIALQTAHVPPGAQGQDAQGHRAPTCRSTSTRRRRSPRPARRRHQPGGRPAAARRTSPSTNCASCVAMLESPVKAKFEKLVPQTGSAVGQKVQADIAPADQQERQGDDRGRRHQAARRRHAEQ